MITICITIGVVALIVCATVAYIMHDKNINKLDGSDISKLEDINIICDHMLEQEMLDNEAEKYFDMRKYRDVVEQIYNITKTYNQ